MIYILNIDPLKIESLFSQKKLFKTAYKLSARLLLVVFAMHVVSVHSLADSLVYCFEENGDVNVESTADLGFLFNSETEVHEEESHDHEQESVFHQDIGEHRDVPITLLCAKEDKVNRFNQENTIADIKHALRSRIASLTPTPFRFVSAYTAPAIEHPIITTLQTVVLLN